MSRNIVFLASLGTALSLAACQNMGASGPMAPVSGGPVAADAQLLEIQTLLNAQGYDAGPEDGIYGAQTRTAIQAWQTDHALVPDGRPDADLLMRLRAGGGAAAETGDDGDSSGGWVDPSI